MTILGHIKDAHVAKHRYLKHIKVAVASLLGIIFLSVGFQGRQHARLQAKLHDITDARDQLLHELDEEQMSTDPLVGGVRGTNAHSSPAPSSSPKVTAFAGALKQQLGRFDYEYGSRRLPEIESLDLRLSKAILANAERRFADALVIISSDDEEVTRARKQHQLAYFIRVFDIRGGSFYGLQEWQNALDCYRQVRIEDPNRTTAIARIAACQSALGRQDEALSTYGELARSHSRRGNASLVQGNRDEAIAHYEKAIAILTPLIDQEGRRELASQLAMVHSHQADAWLAQGNSDLAVAHYEKAIDIETRFIEEPGLDEIADDLARNHNNIGHAYLAQGKLDAAIIRYDKAIELQTRLGEQADRGELSKSHNNRGVVHRAQGKPVAAIEDFERAIDLLAPLVTQSGSNGQVTPPASQDMDRGAQVQLDVSMGYTESAFEALIRTRLVQQHGRRELAAVLGVILKNRGYAHLIHGNLDAAVEDFTKAVDIYARLVEQNGESDLALQFARSLNPLSWIYASHPDEAFRDADKAKTYAIKACELSEWKAFEPIETLAAALAESGDFANAAQWQGRALELAPAKYQAELASRLQLYKSGKPYRAALPEAE